jgi:hypothetical protein
MASIARSALQRRWKAFGETENTCRKPRETDDLSSPIEFAHRPSLNEVLSLSSSANKCGQPSRSIALGLEESWPALPQLVIGGTLDEKLILESFMRLMAVNLNKSFSM